MTSETNRSRANQQLPSFSTHNPFSSTPSTQRPDTIHVDPLESSSSSAFVFPIHSTQAARHHHTHPGSTLSVGGHPSGTADGPGRRKSSSSRKPTPALSASLEDISLQEETKSRSSTSSKPSPDDVFLILPDAPPAHFSDSQPPHLAGLRTPTDASYHQHTSQPSTSSTISSAGTINPPRTTTVFTPPTRAAPQHPLPLTPPSDSSSSRPSRMSIQPTPPPSSPLPNGAPAVQPAVQALRSRYVRPASPGTTPVRSPSPVSIKSPHSAPLTPPAETDKHHGFFSSLRRKKTGTSSRPGSSSSAKDAFGSTPKKAASPYEAPAGTSLTHSPSLGSFHKQHVRTASQGSTHAEPEPTSQISTAFDDYELTDLTPTSSAPPAASSAYFVKKPTLPTLPSSSSAETQKEVVDRRPSTTSQCSSVGGLCSIAPTSWDLDSELNALERRDRRKKGLGEKDSLRIKGKKKETSAEKKARLKREEEAFDPDARPTAKEMFEASLYEVIDGDGKAHMFGDLIKGQRTIVVFIRHWYCPLCSDFVYSIVREVQPEALERAGAKLIIIGNGSPKVVHSYRDKIFNCPFPVYTDPTLELYRALGMTRQTGDAGTEEEKGDYVQHGTLGGTLMVARNLGKMGKKGVTLNPGHFTQLGGEFTLGPGLAAHYAHRMSNTRGHAPIKVALAHAGVLANRRPRPPSAAPAQGSTSAYTGGDSELDRLGWKVSRDSELERMRTWREERRRGRLFNPEGETIRETIHEGEDGSEDGTHRSIVSGRRPSAAESAPYSLRHHQSAAALRVPEDEDDDDVVDISRRPSTPDGTNTSATSQGSHILASAATFGFPTPPQHPPFSPILEAPSPAVAAHPFASPALYQRDSSAAGRARESTADLDLSPIVDLSDPLASFPDSTSPSSPTHLSPEVDYGQRSRFRSNSGGTMGFPNPTGFRSQHSRGNSGETVHSNAVAGEESETSSFSRRDSKDEDAAELAAGRHGEDDDGSEDSSYDALEPVESKMGEEFGFIVPDRHHNQAVAI